VIDYPKRGEIYFVALPAKPKDTKKRPALVVSLDVRNRLAGDIIVIPLSTTLKDSPSHVLLPEGEGGLLKDSMAKCEQITTIDKNLIAGGPFSGRISGEKMRMIEKAVMLSVGLI
jgi:mRNA interferase MazF